MDVKQELAPAADPVAVGREFSAAVVLFHEAVGRLLGLSAAERKCIGVLEQLGPVTAGQIADHTGLTTGSVTGMIDRLHRAGYVDRRPNPADRRSVLVVLRPETPQDAVLPGIFGPLGQDMTALAARFTADEQAAINRWIVGATEVMRARTHALQHPDAS